MRPMSRGSSSNAPPSSYGSSAGMRTAAGLRTSVARPLQSSRLRTGQVPSTPGTQAATGVALNTEIQVSDRPVTQQGMTGMKTGSRGPGRQVQDRSYYVGVLRKKVTEITGEIGRIKSEIERFRKENSQYHLIERKYEDMLKTVRDLEGTLADYNLAMDKIRTSTDPEDVLDYQLQLENRNREEAQEIDKVFLIKQQKEKMITDINQEILDIRQAAENKIRSLGPGKVEEYRELLKLSQQLQEKVILQEEENEKQKSSISHLESLTSRQDYVKEYNAKEKEVHRLQKEQNYLHELLEDVSRDPKQAHVALLEKVKEDNQRANDLDFVITQLKQDMESMRAQLSECAPDGTVNDGPAAQKFEVLLRHDAEMTGFLDSYAETKDAILEDQSRTKEMIVALLEHISEDIQNRQDDDHSRGDDGSTVGGKEGSSFKETSESMMNKLIQDKNRCMEEIDKANALETKIQKELASLASHMDSMKVDMDQFEDIGTLRRTAEDTKNYLLELRSSYIARKEGMKQQLQQISIQYEKKKKELSGNETSKELEALEQKLRHYEQNIFSLREYIETKGRETNYEEVREECNTLVSKLNEKIINSLENSTSKSAIFN